MLAQARRSSLPSRVQRAGRALLGLAMLLSLAWVRSEPARAELVKQKGISYAAWWSGQYSQPEADQSLQLLASTGANWISLIVTGHQQSPSATSIDVHDVSTPTDADLQHAILQAHSLGMKVMLKPHVDLPNERETGIWRGYIGTGFGSEAQWSRWFAAYRGFIEHYARLAQDTGADQFCVGTELLGTTQREADWRAVIAGVRAIYHGPLVYAALHGGEETSIAWWDAVDLIGIDAYYSLTDANWVESDSDLSVSELKARWSGPIQTLATLSSRFGKPIVLTEIGYRSHHGCTSHPWDSWEVSDLDLQEQANAYQAAFESLYNQPWLAGMFWWTWYPDRFQSGACDDSFTPHQKPAEDVLRLWYGGAPRSQAPVLVPDYARAMDIYSDSLATGWEDWSWNATVHMAAVDRVHAGTRSISVTLGAWGALSLRRPSIASGSYRWLEFYVRGASAQEPMLKVFFHAADDRELLHVPVNDCRHIENGTIEADGWKLVRIPLEDLNPMGADVARLNIQDASGEAGSQLWIDDIRLVAGQPASARVFLPLVVRAQR